MTISLVNSSAISVLEPSSELADDLAGRVVGRGAGFVGCLEGAAVEALEVVGAAEVRQRDLGEVDRAAVGIGADDAALVVDRDRLQRAGGEAVLLQQIDLRAAVRIGELGDAAGAEVERRRCRARRRRRVTLVSVRLVTAGFIWPLATEREIRRRRSVQAGALPVAVELDLVEQVPGIGVPPPSVELSIFAQRSWMFTGEPEMS